MERERVKSILLFYRDIDNEIALRARVIADYEDKYYTMHGGTLDGMPRNRGKITKPTETLALNVPGSVYGIIEGLKAEIERLGRLKNEIFYEINKLPYHQKSVIYDFYIQGFKWVQISERIHYCETQCKNIRNRGLEKLATHFLNNLTILNFNYPR